jgi:hypothetical protein
MHQAAEIGDCLRPVIVFGLERHEIGRRIAGKLNPAPAARSRPEQLPGNIGKLIRFAIAAAERKNQRLVRQPLDRDLFGIELNWVGPTAVLDDDVAANPQLAGRRDEPADTVAKCVNIGLRRNRGRGLERRLVPYILRMIAM